MNLDDFDFALPEALIALRPATPRSSARLLVSTAGGITDARFFDLPSFLRAGDRLVLNDTKVIPARLKGTRVRQTPHGDTRAKMDVTLLTPLGQGDWTALVRPLKKLHVGDVIEFSDHLTARCKDKSDGQAVLALHSRDGDLDTALEANGHMPLPPYIENLRPADARDRRDYQTIWARHQGAIAAPTASLHFDQSVMQALAERGVQFSFVTLHVGAGTFLPVQVRDITTHKMHAEWGAISAAAAQEIRQTQAQGGRIIPVGTTALRLLETAGRSGTVEAWEGQTDIFIYPGFDFRVTDALITNFHLPKSTLMMLVSALIGQPRIRAAYAHAIAQQYRFFSYGDASLLIP